MPLLRAQRCRAPASFLTAHPGGTSGLNALLILFISVSTVQDSGSPDQPGKPKMLHSSPVLPRSRSWPSSRPLICQLACDLQTSYAVSQNPQAWNNGPRTGLYSTLLHSGLARRFQGSIHACLHVLSVLVLGLRISAAWFTPHQ
jgi:hypothetical protein